MTPLLRALALCVLSDDGFIIAHSGTDCNESLTTFTVSCGFGNSFFAFGQEDGTFSPQSAILFYGTAVELPQHTVGGQKLQIQRDHMLKEMCIRDSHNGVRPGDCVTLCTSGTPEAIYIVLACSKIGCLLYTSRCV